MPIGTFWTRLGSYRGAGAAGLGARLNKGIAGLMHLQGVVQKVEENIGDTNLVPEIKNYFLTGTKEIRDQIIEGDVLSAYRHLKYLVADLYGVMLGYDGELREEMQRYIRRNERLTSGLFTLDVLEFFRPYKRFAGWLSRMPPFRWVNGIVGQDLDAIDLSGMVYTGIKMGYFRKYFHDSFEKYGYSRRALKEAMSGFWKFVLHAGIEVALPDEAAPFYADNLAFAMECDKPEAEQRAAWRRRFKPLFPPLREEERVVASMVRAANAPWRTLYPHPYSVPAPAAA